VRAPSCDSPAANKSPPRGRSASMCTCGSTQARIRPSK
jgi:hypothetical protein